MNCAIFPPSLVKKTTIILNHQPAFLNLLLPFVRRNDCLEVEVAKLVDPVEVGLGPGHLEHGLVPGQNIAERL